MKLVFNKKIYFVILTICLLTLLLSPQIILAVSGKDAVLEGLDKTAGVGEEGAIFDTTQTNLPAMLGTLLNYLFGLVGVIFLTLALIGGLLWMISGGNEEKVKKAKLLITSGINGMIVIFLAYALVYVILLGLRASVGEGQ